MYFETYKEYLCDNVRLCLVQDRRRAHAMHILIRKQRETQQNSSYTFITASHISHIQLDITVFAYTTVTVSQMSHTSQISQISHITEVTEAGAY